VASILIDGYNVIGIMHKNLEAERERLISALSDYRKRKAHDITVIFDGWKNGPGKESTTVVGGVRVVYSALGETADRVIKRLLGEKPVHWIVVSSDREVQSHAWSHGATPITSDEFLRALDGDTSGGEYFEDDEHESPQRKGRSRQPSRKQKAVERALRKL